MSLPASTPPCPSLLKSTHLYSMSISSNVSMCSLTKLMGTASSDLTPAAPRDLARQTAAAVAAAQQTPNPQLLRTPHASAAQHCIALPLLLLSRAMHCAFHMHSPTAAAALLPGWHMQAGLTGLAASQLSKQANPPDAVICVWLQPLYRPNTRLVRQGVVVQPVAAAAAGSSSSSSREQQQGAAAGRISNTGDCTPAAACEPGPIQLRNDARHACWSSSNSSFASKPQT